ncbi:non-ribosomal peptide synthetase [Amycolatopsis cihanbeyliensis]|uniref:Amino acid adenylation domain-containing protein n=1 Tax=Amycolatopsis cihanbeyliensis TaxID=1128664 RepID=A0A542DFC8_AMYCI|nr:non-ribosomal peptide synthetase [Amycolatopsis cihanbeyliensis]TQJ01798.1 amino acid adenylation domain-containing protein [Amycolatopsis cihanbeyliensis]
MTAIHPDATGTTVENQEPDTIIAAFAAISAASPDAPAVIADDGELSYGRLAAGATAVAERVRRQRPEGPVALLCRHGATTIGGILGSLLAGHPYVPLDPTFPRGRLAYQLADSGAGLLLTDEDNRSFAEEVAGEAPSRPVVVDIDPALNIESTVDRDRLVSPAAPDDPAYLLYTSGSTGKPKGVWQSQRNVVFGARNHIRRFTITPADRTSVLTSFGFDMAVTDTFSALLSGAAAVPIDVRSSGLARLATLLAERGVTIYHSTPTVYRYLLAGPGREEELTDIRVVLLGGEEVTARDVRLCREHLGPECVFVNGYGTTEVSFIAQHHLPPSAPVPDGIVPVGRPLDGIEVLLLDGEGRPGTEGEILVRSPHIALGYHGEAGGAGARFGTWEGERTYRTGDLARRLPDGTLAFLGRADRQVKVRGHRVELGEVETRLADLPGVAQAAVLARTGTAGGDTELIGYAVPSGDGELDPAAARDALAGQLPDYMLPRAIIPLTELPLTVTGKLDERALPDPPSPGPVTEPEGLTELESVIARTWCETLGLDSVGRDEHFFDIGGHSLLMALVQLRLASSLGTKPPMATLFAHPTVGALAAHLAGTATTPDAGQVATERAARRRQARTKRGRR